MFGNDANCDRCGAATEIYVSAGGVNGDLEGYWCRSCLGTVLSSATSDGPTLRLPDDARSALRALPALRAATDLWLKVARRDAIRRSVESGATWSGLARETGLTRAALRKAADCETWITRAPRARQRSLDQEEAVLDVEGDEEWAAKEQAWASVV